jgi:hypothetical protein
VVSHWYFYCRDACAGPFFIKYCGYFPYNAKLCCNGNEYVNCMAARSGIGFRPPDNAFAAVDDAARSRRSATASMRSPALSGRADVQVVPDDLSKKIRPVTGLSGTWFSENSACSTETSYR